MPGRRLSYLFVEAAVSGVTATLTELMECEELQRFQGDTLGAIEYISQEASGHRIEIVPALVKAEGDVPVVLRRVDERSLEAIGRQVVELLGTELTTLEFKSSLWLDTKRQANDRNASPEQLKSKRVCHSAMKTICGFLNEEGGLLVIGVAPDMSVLGLSAEFFVACPGDPNPDGWMQAFRNAVGHFFHEPAEILNQLRIKVGEVDGKFVVIVEVTPRRKLSCCKDESGEYRIYSRRGTSSEEVAVTFVEQYITARNKRLKN